MKASTFLAVFATALLSTATPVPEEQAEQAEQSEQSKQGGYGPVSDGGYGGGLPRGGGGPSFGPGGGFGGPVGGGGFGGGFGGAGVGASSGPGIGAGTGVGFGGGLGGGFAPIPGWGPSPAGFPSFGAGGFPIAGPPPNFGGPAWPPCSSCFPQGNPLGNGGLQQAANSCSNQNVQNNVAISCCNGGGLLGLGCTLNIISDICSQKGASIACCPVTGNSAGPLTLINLGAACLPITL